MLRQFYHILRRTRPYFIIIKDLGMIEWNGSDWNWLNKVANSYEDIKD